MRRLRPDLAATALCVAGVSLFAASPVLAGSDVVHADAPPVRYDAMVGPDARATVDVEYDAGGWSHVELAVTGFAPESTYAARARLGGCAPTAPGLAEVFQMSPNPDPEMPEDPTFRNPHNEVWLDVETDGSGAGTGRATQGWQFHPLRRPGSVTIHEALPKVHPAAPVVGAALACVEVGF